MMAHRALCPDFYRWLPALHSINLRCEHSDHRPRPTPFTRVLSESEAGLTSEWAGLSILMLSLVQPIKLFKDKVPDMLGLDGRERHSIGMK